SRGEAGHAGRAGTLVQKFYRTCRPLYPGEHRRGLGERMAYTGVKRAMMCGITGTPGTGKSTVADELARRGHRVVHITDIVQPYVLSKDPQRDTQIIDTDRMADEFVSFDGFVEGHFAHLLPCDCIVVLRLRPDALIARLKARGYSSDKIAENRDAEALDVCLIETVDLYDPED